MVLFLCLNSHKYMIFSFLSNFLCFHLLSYCLDHHHIFVCKNGINLANDVLALFPRRDPDLDPGGFATGRLQCRRVRYSITGVAEGHRAAQLRPDQTDAIMSY